MSKCLQCHRSFEVSKEEWRELVRIANLEWEVRPYDNSLMPPYCSWECLKAAKKIAVCAGSRAERELRTQMRGSYHIGETGALPGSRQAKLEEEHWREKMAESCKRNPPRGLRAISASEPTHPPLLPSEMVFGDAKRRVLDDGAVKLGGEDGEKFNFYNE